jgi:hypothetical protein
MMVGRQITLLLILMLTGCAEVGPPPGGPEDKEGPVVMESQPANGSVNLTAVRTLEIQLSEQIQVPKGSSVLISPRPQIPPKVSWGGHGVKIEFADTLPSNRTYIVSLPAGMSDLRGNKPDSAITLAFSTGPILDSGAITGRVFVDEKATSGVAVALYDEKYIQPEMEYDSVYPDYLTVTGKNGEYVFRHLPTARFRLIAFQKSGRDDRFRPMRDKFALPDREIDLGGRAVVTDINLSLTSQDTLPLRIISALVNSDRVVQLRLSRPVSRMQISGADSIMLTLGAVRFSARADIPSDSESTGSVAAYFGQLPSGVAQLSWALDKSRSPMAFDSLRIPLYADSTPPRQVLLVPGDKPLLTADTAVHLRFSEPIDTLKLTDTSVVIVSTKDSMRIRCDRIAPNPFELTYRPKGLAAGESYSISVHEFELFDLAGNTVGDSVRQFRFSIIDPDSIGWIEGVVRAGASDSVAGIVLRFRKLSDGQQFQFPSTSRSFKFGLPAGKYLVSGFVDRNANGRFDRGLVFPYTLSEPFLPYSDTVSVRARFETAGVELEFK